MDKFGNWGAPRPEPPRSLRYYLVAGALGAVTVGFVGFFGLLLWILLIAGW